MRPINWLMTLGIGFVLVTAGCGESTVEEEGEVEELGGKADGVPRPLGTYAPLDSAPVEVGDLASLTLREDMTFERWFVCPPTARCIAETGRYKYTRGPTKRYLRFYTGGDAPLDRYTYELDGATLRLREDGSDRWQTLELVPEPSECGDDAECRQDCRELALVVTCPPDTELSLRECRCVPLP